MRLAIIPARGGSKRIPRKNIKEFCGKPMIAYSIEAAKKSGCFDKIIVSTDDEEIAALARTLGAEVPFMRPKELSDDHTATIPVIAHAIRETCHKELSQLDAICCIYATAPFVQAMFIKEAYEKLKLTKASYAFSATSFPFPIQRAIRLTKEDRVEMFSPENFNTRSQDLEDAYHDAGQFYWGTPEAWLEGKIIFAPHSTAVLLPRHLVQDIDTPEDWMRAEFMFKALGLHENTHKSG
ncbi:pseudaminic acid cytidylyltransferase [Sulfurospirillum diekertiae]|uniref:Pseudaminic acid cytidylyltransferase n=1 Tax=Sulfurospirillum diekertiae TaxID=1854492 RepID=A0A1Y0HQ33_9BACT|nr:pseudaminic acid cytidylyltransferase [Sulfurospirillum diekertiae]ARU50040.1 CMP-N,N'-diacetyllegionaminic acid synthase [Sulfurospirillum diekertiae]ASC94828.1 CMP-N,N'-diacetyllegionaminic acid synthase [Sulfurospirillum diekertiae]